MIFAQCGKIPGYVPGGPVREIVDPSLKVRDGILGWDMLVLRRVHHP